jgi:predicted GNAT family N-acyltransferase
LYENTPIGTLRANLTIKDTVKIQRFCFLPEYRKHGFGKLLLEFAENELINKGYSYFFLEAKFAVHHFYEKCGYKRVSDIFYEVDVPHVKMEKHI